MQSDPFRHHPELRHVITPVEDSFFRDFDPARLDQQMAELGNPPDWRFTTEQREAFRARELAGRMDRDLWVFAYGSLCWDPAVAFDEIRRAHVPSHARRFYLKDQKGGRGTRDNPGLIAVLAEGSGCDGLAFRIPAAALENATRTLWARERIASAYDSAFLTAQTAQGPIETLAFVANPEADSIDTTMTRAEQARYVAHGHGILGSSLDYVRKLKAGLAAIQISDPDLDRLLADAEALLA